MSILNVSDVAVCGGSCIDGAGRKLMSEKSSSVQSTDEVERVQHANY